MDEPKITILIRKAVLRLKKVERLTNLQLGGEVELLDLESEDPEVTGRIDITFTFLEQFGDEDSYLGVESKRLDKALCRKYVTEGVDRFATGKYGKAHSFGIMLAYVLTIPPTGLAEKIDEVIQELFGAAASLADADGHECALMIRQGVLKQQPNDHLIRISHVFVDMAAAA